MYPNKYRGYLQLSTNEQEEVKNETLRFITNVDKKIAAIIGDANNTWLPLIWIIRKAEE